MTKWPKYLAWLLIFIVFCLLLPINEKPLEYLGVPLRYNSIEESNSLKNLMVTIISFYDSIHAVLYLLNCPEKWWTRMKRLLGYIYQYNIYCSVNTAVKFGQYYTRARVQYCEQYIYELRITKLTKNNKV